MIKLKTVIFASKLSRRCYQQLNVFCRLAIFSLQFAVIVFEGSFGINFCEFSETYLNRKRPILKRVNQRNKLNERCAYVYHVLVRSTDRLSKNIICFKLPTFKLSQYALNRTWSIQNSWIAIFFHWFLFIIINPLTPKSDKNQNSMESSKFHFVKYWKNKW